VISKGKIIAAFGMLSILLSLLIRCSNSVAGVGDITDLAIPHDTAATYLDERNPYTFAKAELGRYLFYDRRLSINNTKACASCHAQEFSFTDSYHRSAGALGDLVKRNSRPLINIIFNKYLTSADSTLHFPEQQINNPLMNEHPVEMGIKGNETMILERLAGDPLYRHQFAAAFPADKEPFTIQNLQWAISSFVKSIFSFDARYDHYRSKHDSSILTAAERKGMQLFFSDSLQCHSCHGGINFSTPILQDEQGLTSYYFNTGVYNITDTQNRDDGLAELTGRKEDAGKFRVPTLRNLAFTAPYFHDGSVATLEEIIIGYERRSGEVNGSKWSNKSNGSNRSEESKGAEGIKNQDKHLFIKQFRLNSQERKELIAFLLSLSDSTVCRNPAYANPFSDDETKRQHEKK
jgi:cytochrome c peroxidase